VKDEETKELWQADWDDEDTTNRFSGKAETGAETGT